MRFEFVFESPRALRCDVTIFISLSSNIFKLSRYPFAINNWHILFTMAVPPMRPARFTRDPKRIAILEQNWKEGVEREALPLQERIISDMQALNVSVEHLARLRVAAGLDKQ